MCVYEIKVEKDLLKVTKETSELEGTKKRDRMTVRDIMLNIYRNLKK